MSGREKAQKVLVEMRRHGLPPTLHHLALRSINSVVVFKILRGVAVERADPEFLRCPAQYTPMFLPERMIRDFARDPETEMSESFVEEALSRGDQCYGIRHDRTLAAYGWYSLKPTRIDPPDLLLHFRGGYHYMYKGFTHPRYRGQRLHAIAMTMALQHYLSTGFKGLVAYVESSNFDSLRSVSRMGYVQFGSVYVLKVFGRYLTHSSRGCTPFGFRIEPVPESVHDPARRR